MVETTEDVEVKDDLGERYGGIVEFMILSSNSSRIKIVFLLQNETCKAKKLGF